MGEFKRTGLRCNNNEYLVVFCVFVAIQTLVYYLLDVPFVFEYGDRALFGISLLLPAVLLGVFAMFFFAAASMSLPYDRQFFNNYSDKSKIENCEFCEQYRIAPEAHSLVLNRCLVSEIYVLYLLALLFYLLFNLYLLGIQVVIFVEYVSDRSEYTSLLVKTLLPDVFEYTVFVSISFIFSFCASLAVLVVLVLSLVQFRGYSRINAEYLCYIHQAIVNHEDKRNDVNPDLQTELNRLLTLRGA
jgi:hypothetical protein